MNYDALYRQFLTELGIRSGQEAVCEAAYQAYKACVHGMFENSAVDINRKQVAAEKGITQQGIVNNGNLCNLDSNPFDTCDHTIQGLINRSYASRFGASRGTASPAANSRTSNGMYGGGGPQNTNASCTTD